MDVIFRVMAVAVTVTVGSMVVLQGRPGASEPATPAAPVRCGPARPEQPPVLLIHGTGMTSASWGGYLPALEAAGFRACTIDLPGRSEGDIRVTAGSVASAIVALYRADGGRPVDVVTHSQGGLDARWALKYFAATQGEVTTVVELGAPNHGTDAVPFVCSVSPPCSVAAEQMEPQSSLLQELNAGTETPGRARYVSIYSTSDALITPVDPPTAALRGAVNLPVQAICFGRVVTHQQFLTDPLVVDLVLRALEGAPLMLPPSACA